MSFDTGRDASTPSRDTSAELPLEARVAALEQEDARLREEVSGSGASPRGGRWRAWASATCVVLAAILVPVSVVTSWARVQLVDEDAFAATLAPLASDPDAQGMIIDETMSAIGEKVDFAALTGSVIDGVQTLGLPSAASSALDLLRQPAADGLAATVERAVTRVVESPAFAEVWATTTRAAHRALVTTATSDGGGLVVRTDDGVGIQLGAVVERVKQTLTAQGVGAAALIPSVDRVVILGSGENLSLVRTVYALAVAVGFWLPFVCLGLFLGGILVARRRSSAVLGSGVALAIGGASLAAAVAIGAALMSAVAAQAGISPSGLGVVYAAISDGMAHTAKVVALVGLVLAVLAWAHSRSRAATALRAAFASINADVRRALAWRGIDTGAWGAWLYTRRTLVRALIAALALLWLILLRPLTGGDVVLVTVVASLTWWLTELLQRRPGEAFGVSTDAAAQRAAGASEAAFGDSDEAAAAEAAKGPDAAAPGPFAESSTD